MSIVPEGLEIPYAVLAAVGGLDSRVEFVGTHRSDVPHWRIACGCEVPRRAAPVEAPVDESVTIWTVDLDIAARREDWPRARTLVLGKCDGCGTVYVAELWLRPGSRGRDVDEF